MIIKNESKIIKRCLDNIISFVDYIVLTDTGSTDDTINICNQYIIDNNINGKIYTDLWVNFAVNRTNSINNAKEFLKSKKYNLNYIFLLFIDADMIIEINNFDKSLLTKDHYLIKQYNPHISYYNLRLVKSSLKLEYKSVTHEYLDIGKSIDYINKLDSIKINDIGDGGSKDDKFIRDIKLLKQGIKDEPENDRYYFYLAQSYKDIDDFKKAIKYYNLRIKMGGWIEEIFYSYYMLGQIYNKNNNWKMAETCYLLAWSTSNQTRSEPLYEIVKYYRLEENYQKSYEYIKLMINTPYPSNQVLFITDSVYSYKPYEELGLIAFYLEKTFKNIGLYATEIVKFDKTTPKDIYYSIMTIQTYYLQQFESSVTGLNAKPEKILNTNLDSLFNLSNSCLKYINNNMYAGIIRTINYKINDDGIYEFHPESNNIIQTKNYWCLIKNNNIISQNEITISNTCDCPKKHITNVIGLEDGRYIVYNGKIYISFVSLEYGIKPEPSLVLAHLNKDYQITKIIQFRYNSDLIQKNWVPFIYKEKLCWIYSYDPFILLQVNVFTGHCSEIIKITYNYNFSSFRGSTSPIILENNNDTILTLVHEVSRDAKINSKRIYSHRFLLYSKEFHLLQISEPFYFTELFVEYCISLTYNSKINKLVLFFTVRDKELYSLEFDYNMIKWLPFDIKEYIIKNL